MLDGGMNRLVAHRKASDAVRHHECLMKAPARGARSARTVMVRPAEAFKAGDERPARLSGRVAAATAPLRDGKNLTLPQFYILRLARVWPLYIVFQGGACSIYCGWGGRCISSVIGPLVPCGYRGMGQEKPPLDRKLG